MFQNQLIKYVKSSYHLLSLATEDIFQKMNSDKKNLEIISFKWVVIVALCSCAFFNKRSNRVEYFSKKQDGESSKTKWVVPDGQPLLCRQALKIKKK